MIAEAKKHGIPVENCIMDPAISPIGADSEGHLKRIVGAMQIDPRRPWHFSGVHMSVGLSNFTVMLPPKRADGSPTKGPLESAFLPVAMPIGLDHVIGSVKRKYELLPPEHPAMQCLNDCLKLDGFDVIMRVQEYYACGGTTMPLTDIEIARATKIKPIGEIAAKLRIPDKDLEHYGHYKAKVSLDFFHSLDNAPTGKLILVTAINPTAAGEGKTTATVGLGDALNRFGKRAVICLREPSLGPCFGRQRWRGRWWLRAKYPDGGHQPSLYRRFPRYWCRT